MRLHLAVVCTLMRGSPRTGYRLGGGGACAQCTRGPRPSARAWRGLLIPRTGPSEDERHMNHLRSPLLPSSHAERILSVTWPCLAGESARARESCSSSHISLAGRNSGVCPTCPHCQRRPAECAGGWPRGEQGQLQRGRTAPRVSHPLSGLEVSPIPEGRAATGAVTLLSQRHS